MQLTVNGELHTTDQQTVQELLDSLQLHAQLVVVEHNGTVLNRDRFGRQRLHEGDVLEIVRIVAGGSPSAAADGIRNTRHG